MATLHWHSRFRKGLFCVVPNNFSPESAKIGEKISLGCRSLDKYRFCPSAGRNTIFSNLNYINLWPSLTKHDMFIQEKCDNGNKSATCCASICWIPLHFHKAHKLGGFAAELIDWFDWDKKLKTQHQRKEFENILQKQCEKRLHFNSTFCLHRRILFAMSSQKCF